MSVACGQTLTFVCRADLDIGMDEVSAFFLLLVLHDGFSCGIVDCKLLGDLYDKTDDYIDDAPPFLNASQKFFPGLLPNLLISFAGKVVLDVDGGHFIANKLYLLT